MKSVVIVEDNKPQREVLLETLTQYRFKAVGEPTIAGTLELLRKHKDDAAVIILDMELGKFPDYKEQADKEGSPITGIGLAKKVLRESMIQRPEIIIHSIHGDRVEYYKQAIEAGASAYSQKGEETDRTKFVSVIQALALKHSFQPNSLNEAEIARLEEGHANSFELLEYFCHHKLARELDLCLAGAPIVLLFRDKSGAANGPRESVNCVSVYANVGIPEAEQFDYAKLHQRILDQRKLDPQSRYRSYSPESDLFPNGKENNLKEFLFIELVSVAEVEIALGILAPFPVHDALGEFPFSTQSLAESLLEHASPALETFVQKLLFRWREKQIVKIGRVETSVGLSGNVQRRLSPLVRDQRLRTAAEASAHFGGLRQLSQELTDYNRSLSALLAGSRNTGAGAKGETTRLSEVVQEIKNEYDRLGHLNDISFAVAADGLVPAERQYFSQALRALAEWAFQRRAQVAGRERQQIQIRCAVHGNWLEVHFQENSERLSKRVREAYLFEPMSPLQVAQMIIEVACHGRLVDATDELETRIGHLLKIRLLQH
jgi:CheY-like chemotaxis protein